jgi:competence protein ComFC
MESVLHAFKFERHDFFDEPLAALLEMTIRARGDLDFDTIVPVPMSRDKERRRGYNQAELLARQLSRKLGIRCRIDVLTKRRGGETQSTLARKERRANVRDAFCGSRKAAGRAILLVDDITTTGETLRACARELLRHEAARVCAVAVAKAV